MRASKARNALVHEDDEQLLSSGISQSNLIQDKNRIHISRLPHLIVSSASSGSSIVDI